MDNTDIAVVIYFITSKNLVIYGNNNNDKEIKNDSMAKHNGDEIIYYWKIYLHKHQLFVH